MRVQHVPTRDEVQQERKRRYLERWPVEKQLEAIAEFMAGRKEKQERMTQDFATIREALPYFTEVK